MKKSFIILIMTVFLLAGCNSKDKSESHKAETTDGKLKVATSTYPMYYIAEEIGKEIIDLDILIPIGVDPHDYELSLKEMKELEDTDLFLYNGAGLENWGEKVASDLKAKGKITIDASTKVDLIDASDEHDEQEEHENESHGSKDPHIWLDPINMEKIAKDLTEQLKILDEKNSDLYQTNYVEFKEKIDALDLDYKEQLKNKKQNTILVSHKAFSYLANRYGLEQISVTGISPHAEPSPKSISKLIDITREKNLEYIFFEVLSSPKSVQTIANEANLKVLTLNPLGGITKDQFDSGIDYIDIMEENLANLKKALVD